MVDRDVSSQDSKQDDTFVQAVFVQAVKIETDFEKLAQLCTDYFTAHGATMSSYHHVPPVGASDHEGAITVTTQGYPEDWVKKYVEEKLYKIDPIPKRAAIDSQPFWWSELDGDPKLTKDEQHFMDLLREADLGDGLAIPLFGPHGRNGYAGVGFGKNHKFVTTFEVARLQNAAQLAHQRYCTLLREKERNEVPLSAREAEILKWVVRGKSNSVIADILGISSYTVDTYIRRIFGKLGVSSRVTAALRALALGLVD